MEGVGFLEKSIRKELQSHSEFVETETVRIREEIGAAEKELDGLPDTRVNIHRRRDLGRRLRGLRESLDDLESGRAQHRQCVRSRRFLESLFSQHQDAELPTTMTYPGEDMSTKEDTRISDNPLNLNKRSQKLRKHVITKRVAGSSGGSGMPGSKMILDEFSNNKKRASRSVYVLPHLRCAACNIHMHKMIDASVMVCPRCGTSSKYLDSSSKSLGYHDDVEYVSVSYKRQNHFQEWLNAFQGRETNTIPDSVIESVMSVLYSSGIRDKADITRDMIREILKCKTMKRYKKNITSIMCRITGQDPPRLKPEEEDKLKIMFNSIQKPFEKYRPKDRKNFLSYSYVIYKFCELLGLDRFLPFFKLLKGRDKLYKQDRIWEPICRELEWEFVPSI